MKAIRITGGEPQLVELEQPQGEGVLVKVASSSICGSDIHMLNAGWAEGWILGHEFAGTTPDGTAVAVEPLGSCGHCHWCLQGYNSHCDEGAQIIGVGIDGGMAEYVLAPEQTIMPLPSGLDLRNASLVEPLAVAAHGINRARVSDSDRVLVVGAGPVGLATVAVLNARGIACDIIARHPHQQQAAEKLGATVQAGEGYDVVIDAVGTSETIEESIQRARPLARIGMVGSFWDPAMLSISFCMKEVEIIAATTYQRCASGTWEFREAGDILAARPEIADILVSHRFPLDAASEAFSAAQDRAAGAIKVVFDL